MIDIAQHADGSLGVNPTKTELRAAMRAEKRKHGADELRMLSDEIVGRLLQNFSFVSAKCVLLYCSLPDEVQTDGLLSILSGKSVLLPVVDGDNLILRHYDGAESLQREPRFGILEPTGLRFDDYNRIDCAVIPGMAFDREGNRLGRGRGYYDRLLPLVPQAHLIGLCFPFQVVSKVPVDSHDVCMDEVVF